MTHAVPSGDLVDVWWFDTRAVATGPAIGLWNLLESRQPRRIRSSVMTAPGTIRGMAFAASGKFIFTSGDGGEEVGRLSGSFALQGRETVLDGIIAAGGLNDKASRNNIILSRPTPPDGCRLVLPICYSTRHASHSSRGCSKKRAI